jgi:hypothetical protein
MYSIIAILLSAPIFLFTAYYITASQTLKFGSEEKVIADQIHEVERSIEDDFIRGVEISGRRALIAAIDYIVTSGFFLDDSKFRIEELMTESTIYGNVSYVMQNNTLADWRSKILNVSTSFDSNLSYYDFSMESDGFDVKFNIGLNVNVSHRNRDLAIKRNDTFQGIVSIENIEDPIMTIKTRGYVRRVFKKYPFSFYARKIVEGIGEGSCIGNVTFDSSSMDNEKILVTYNGSEISGFRGVVAQTTDIPDVDCYVVGASDAVEKINQTINEINYTEIYLDNETNAVWSLPINFGLQGNYYYPGDGPNILNRLEGNLTNTSNGIFTFVNTDELQQFGLEVKANQSVLDYIYFSNDTVGGYLVRGLPSWFRIDIYSAGKFNLTELLY